MISCASVRVCNFNFYFKERCRLNMQNIFFLFISSSRLLGSRTRFISALFLIQNEAYDSKRCEYIQVEEKFASSPEEEHFTGEKTAREKSETNESENKKKKRSFNEFSFRFDSFIRSFDRRCWLFSICG